MLSPMSTPAFPTITSTPLGSAFSEGTNSFKRPFACEDHCGSVATKRCQSAASTRQRAMMSLAARECLLRLHLLVLEQGHEPAYRDTQSAEEEQGNPDSGAMPAA